MFVFTGIAVIVSCVIVTVIIIIIVIVMVTWVQWKKRRQNEIKVQPRQQNQTLTGELNLYGKLKCAKETCFHFEDNMAQAYTHISFELTYTFHFMESFTPFLIPGLAPKKNLPPPVIVLPEVEQAEVKMC